MANIRAVATIAFLMTAGSEPSIAVSLQEIPAEVKSCKAMSAWQPLRYRRFATAAEAIRFAVEELPAVRTLGAWMQVGDERFNGEDIQRLYESDDYPLQRRPSD